LRARRKKATGADGTRLELIERRPPEAAATRYRKPLGAARLGTDPIRNNLRVET